MAGKYLTHAAEEVVQQLLIDLGLGYKPPVPTKDWLVYATQEPDSEQTPDNIITVYGPSNSSDGRLQIDGSQQINNGIMIRVRGENFDAGWKKMSAIQAAMDTTVYGQTVTVVGKLATASYTVDCANLASGPFKLGKDDGGVRELFSVNYLFSIYE